MQDFGTKADNSPPPSGQLSAAEFNNLATENETAVLRSGQALSGTSTDQLAGALFINGVKASGFQDSGAANTYVATPQSGASGVLVPTVYSNMGGAVISFKASNTNTGASTVNIGQTTGALIGAKPIRTGSDSDISAGTITAGQYVSLIYNPAFNSGSGAWEILPWASTQTAAPGAFKAKMSVLADSATATLTADIVTATTGIGGKSYVIPNFSKTINVGITGLGGMDTGSPAVSGFLSIYAIYNPTTQVSGLLACIQTVSNGSTYTGANAPAGFTASALVASWPSTAAQILSVGFLSDRTVARPATMILNSSTNVGSQASLSITNAVPTNTKFISGYITVTSNALSNITVILYPSATSNGGAQSTVWGASPAGSTQTTSLSLLQIASPGAIGYISTSSGGTPTFQVFVNAYVF